MARPLTFGGIELDVDAGQPAATTEGEPLKLKTEAEDPFRILVLGDFSGRGDGVTNPLRVDRDNLDEVMRALRVETTVSLGNQERLSMQLKFEALEHFEPDSLFERCDLFRMIERPKQATESASVAQAAAGQGNIDADVARLSSGSLLDAIIEQDAGHTSGPTSPAKPASRDELQEIIERVTRPHLQPRQDAEAAQATKERCERINILMRAVLHEPHLQALEAAWRSLDFLVRNIESDSRVQIYVFDISKERLAADLLQHPGFRSTAGDAGAEPWALIVGNYAFDRNVSSDIDLLAQLGLLARSAQAPFLAEAAPSWRQDPAAFDSWQILRKSSHATWLGLAIPRFLLRLPYGKETTTVESFDFEEMPEPPQYEEYLWGNSAFGCAYLLALSFLRFGWDFRPGMHRDIAGLPLHMYKKKGTAHTQPCAEMLLTESDWNALLDEGLMPLAAAKDADWARLVRFQSIAEPLAPLSGRWI